MSRNAICEIVQCECNHGVRLWAKTPASLPFWERIIGIPHNVRVLSCVCIYTELIVVIDRRRLVCVLTDVDDESVLCADLTYITLIYFVQIRDFKLDWNLDPTDWSFCF